MKNKEEKSKGITLIALIVTILVLLILAGISINFVIGENGILTKASLAKEKNSNASETENGVLSQYEQSISKYVSGRSSESTFTSNLVDSVTLTGGQTANYIDINVAITKKVENINYICILFVNNKLYKSYTSNEITTGVIRYPSVEASKLYEFYTIIVDEDGGIVKSNSLSITTGTSSFQWQKTEYPVLTTAGIVNMKNADQYGNIIEYKKDLAQGNCTAADALPIEAWDGNTGTCVRTGTYYIKIDSAMIGKTLTWNQYWLSGCSSTFSLCDSAKTVLSTWGSDVSGTKTIIANTEYVKYWSNGHYLYEISGQ